MIYIYFIELTRVYNENFKCSERNLTSLQRQRTCAIHSGGLIYIAYVYSLCCWAQLATTAAAQRNDKEARTCFSVVFFTMAVYGDHDHHVAAAVYITCNM